MTPEHVFGGLLVQSLGIVGALLTRKKRQADPQPPSPLPPQDLGEASRASFRAAHGVREIAPEQEGFALDGLPAGSYGFTYAPLTESPLFAKQTAGSFEMHRSLDGSAYLITFVAPEDRRRIEFGAAEVPLRLYPDPYGDATEIVSLDTVRLSSKKRNPSRRDGNWLEATLHRA